MSERSTKEEESGASIVYHWNIFKAFKHAEEVAKEKGLRLRFNGCRDTSSMLEQIYQHSGHLNKYR